VPRPRTECPICKTPMITIEARIGGDPSVPMNRWSRRKVGEMCIEPGCNCINRQYFVSLPTV
jgi:hypothetical protein